MLGLNTTERDLLSNAASCALHRPTRWCAITGAPGSGKTTLVELLARQGFPIAVDPGRVVLQQHLANGVEVGRSGPDYVRLQEEVLQYELGVIDVIDPEQRVFFDYGVAEALAFMKLAGLTWPKHFVDAAAALQFSKVFLLSPLKLDQPYDGVRVETERQRDQLWRLIGEVYGCLGMDVVKIKSATLRQRLDEVCAALD
ncbi:ATP/GTP-binding protein [Acidovorax sp. NCPPB 4044]|uniref:ATP/GTP-binding protein n=1 Tax=Acidovorax sp. NCPPB 4044 TaxID=2940490 RepID=UPI0023022C8F|nr:ATP-binding protein [Acidovorax sp. NCPPB 4044]MDA8520127.1 ATP-binding protein [Acidovorax sp. NCPPB 4044]